MSLALFKLESFSNAVAARVEVTYTQADLDQAFADGVAQASAQAQDDQLRALSASLEQVAAGLAADETRRRQMRQEAVDALAPILHQVLDLMAPPLSSRRLEGALQAELTHLAQRATPVGLRIACNDRLADMVRRCLAQAGLEGIEIAPVPQDLITVSLQGGHIDFTPDSIAGDIRALIAEITQEDSTWTH